MSRLYPMHTAHGSHGGSSPGIQGHEPRCSAEEGARTAQAQLAEIQDRRIDHGGQHDLSFLFHCEANPIILGNTLHRAAARSGSGLNASGRHRGEENALMRQRNAVLVNGNALRLGLFGANCASGRTYATLAERWDASWENNVRLAQLA